MNRQAECYADLFEALRQGVMYLDGDGFITQVNSAALTILNIAKEDLLGKKAQSVFAHIVNAHGLPIPEEEHPCVLALKTAKEVVMNDVGCQHEQTSETVWLRVRAIPLLHPQDGRPHKVLLLFRDVTETERIKQELTAARDYTENLIETANVMIVGLDTEGRITVFNRAAERITGYVKSELEGRNWFAILVPKERYPQVWEIFRKRAKNELPKHFENPIVTKNGEERYIVWQNNEIRSGGRIVGSISYGIDITDRRKTEAAGKESERKYRILFESSQDAIMILTPGGRYVDANQATLRIFGCPNIGEFIALSPLRLSPVHQPDGRLSAVKADEMMALALKKGSHLFEWTHCTAEGKEFVASVLLTRMEIGETALLQATVRDITEQKRDEETRMVAEKLRSLGVLAGGIAHDFNNLLVAVMGHNQLALIEKDAEAARRYMRANDEVFERMINLTRQLLTFATGSKSQLTVCSVEKVLRRNTEFFLSGSNIKVEYQFAPDLFKVKIDQNQMGQVVQNLVSNAKAAMPQGGTLRIEAENLGEERIRIRVMDTGCGIPAELLPLIFDPYFTTKKDQGGSGLGLAICHSIIHKHGGRISVKSHVGKGTRFSIILPKASGNVQDKTKQSSAPPDKIKHVRKILVVDDEAMLRRVVSALLERIGYRAVTASNGREAIEHLILAGEQQDPFEAVICDLTIPGEMSGEHIMAELLKINPDIIGIVASGYADVPAVAEFKKYGFRAAISKPFRIQELATVLANIFGGE